MRVKLTDICTPRQWKTIPTSELLEDGYPVYGANGVIGHYGEYNHENSVIAITCRGATCGRVNITVPKSYVTGNAMCLDNVKPSVLQYYLYYCLLQYDFDNVISGSAQPQITRQGLEKVSINLYSLEKQEAIVNVLDKVCNTITYRQQILQKLDELVKSRFIEMFIDNKVFNIDSLENVSETLFAGGDRPADSSETQDDEYMYPVYANAETNNGLLCYSKTYKVDRPSVTIAARGCTVGFTCVRNEKFTPVVRLITIVPKDDVNVVYLKYYLDLQISIEGNGCAQPQLTIPTVKKYSIVVPPIELQNEFAIFVEQIDKSKFAVQKSLEQTQLLFDSLMQKYFG